MTLKQFANVDSWCRDLNTGQEVPWREYMGRVIEKLGIENIKFYIPFEIEYLKEKVKEDVHFNNTPIKVWDNAAGYASYVNRKIGVQDYTRLRYGVVDLFIHNGITSFSVSDGVCVLKEAARRLCGE